MEIVEEDVIVPQQQQEEEYEEQPQFMYPRGGIAQPLPNSDPDFMRWLFDLKNQVVTPLKYAWMGYELNENGVWKKKTNSRPIMNMDGINWCSELIESYINPAYIISNYNEKWFNYTMRLCTSVIINNLTSRHKEFGLDKLDIENVALQIESKIQAILLGARADGYRQFFGKTRQEHVMTQKLEGQQPKKTGILGLFNKKEQHQIEGYQ